MVVSSQLHAPTALPLRQKPVAPIAQVVGWVPELVWMFWRRQKYLGPAGNQATILQLPSLRLRHYTMPMNSVFSN
jgi:hypothetical protein